MAHRLSDVAGFKIDGATAVLTDISGSVNSVTVNGGNGLVEDTGLGDAVRTQMRDLGIVNTLSVNGMVNSTVYDIIAPLINGTSTTKTVQVASATGDYLSGEAYVGAVSLSIPVGMQTFSMELASSSNTGFTSTSVSL